MYSLPEKMDSNLPPLISLPAYGIITTSIDELEQNQNQQEEYTVKEPFIIPERVMFMSIYKFSFNLLIDLLAIIDNESLLSI